MAGHDADLLTPQMRFLDHLHSLAVDVEARDRVFVVWRAENDGADEQDGRHDAAHEHKAGRETDVADDRQVDLAPDHSAHAVAAHSEAGSRAAIIREPLLQRRDG